MTTPLSGTYSFVDVQVALLAPSAAFNISDNGIAAEGIRVAMTEDKDAMTIGADGSGMHSLRASKAGRVTVNLLKISPINAMLNALYRYQSLSSANWGQVQITITNPVTGDNITAQEGAFARQADVGYRVDGDMMVWPFNFVDIDEILGQYYFGTLVTQI